MIMIVPSFSNRPRMIIVVIISNGVKTNIRGNNDSNDTDIVIMIAITMALTMMMMVVVVVVVMSFS